MCRRGGVAAALVALAAWINCVEPLFAQEPANGGGGDRFLFFSGFDIWRDGDFLHGGILWSPQGLAQEGFTLKVLLSGGSYRYHAGTIEITGNQGLAAAMPGWRFKSDRLEVTLFAGIDLQYHWLTPDDPGNRLRGTHPGLRAGFDLWYEPADMIMTTASLWASTIDTNVWGRVAAGVRFLDRVWLGPEAVGFRRPYLQPVAPRGACDRVPHRTL